jgi:lysophospholipase L1-like esterase
MPVIERAVLVPAGRKGLNRSTGCADRLLRWLLLVSLAANLLAAGLAVEIVRGRGGFAYLKAWLDHDSVANIDPGYSMRQSLFDRLPLNFKSRAVVFLGDSLVASCEWRELFGNRGNIINRGIGGDTSAGVLKRAASIGALKPLAVFLMIGTNDPQALGYSPDDTLGNYRGIIQTILKESPQTTIYLQSLLPSRTPKFNKWSARVNQGIRRLADGRSTIYLDLRASFLDDGVLASYFTQDGIHLNGTGYLNWKTLIEPVVSPLLEAR